MVLTTMLRNFKETGYPFLFRQRQLFLENIGDLALSDLTMSATSALVVPLNMLYSSGPRWLQWTKGGIWIQSIFQAGWLLYWVE